MVQAEVSTLVHRSSDETNIHTMYVLMYVLSPDDNIRMYVYICMYLCMYVCMYPF